MTLTDPKKISLIQQASWKLQEAKRLIEEALGTSENDQWYSGYIEDMLTEIDEVELGLSNTSVEK